jgi:hypothetical protein
MHTAIAFRISEQKREREFGLDLVWNWFGFGLAAYLVSTFA